MRLPARIAQNRTFAALLIAIMLINGISFSTSASTDLSPGQGAIVTDTGGDPINLRAKPSTDSKVVGAAYEGQIVDVIGGPIWDDDGIVWYKIVANGARAYMFGGFSVRERQ